MLVRPDAPKTLLLYLLGPLVGYLAAATVFRGGPFGLLEYELACPPSARQLVLARLSVVLAYTIALGTCLSLAVAWQAAGVLVLTWLGPLLIEVGLTLLLTLRLSTELAAGLAYAGWAAILAVVWASGAAPIVPSVMLDLTLAAMGLVAVAVAVFVAPWLLDRELGMRRLVG